MTSFRSKTAFTLIELLSVIAVIGILAALLFPVLGSAQERGKLTQCLSNVRQWGTATTLYISDNGGKFPTKGAPANGVASTASNAMTVTAWFNVLPAYMGTPRIYDSWRRTPNQMPRPLMKSVFICPSAKPELTIGATDNSAYYSSYAQNYWIGSTAREADSFGQVLRLSQIKNPAIFPVMAENASGMVDSQPAYKLAHTHAYFMGFAASGNAFRHNGMANIVFADGHAASFKKEDIFSESVDVNANCGGIQWNPDREVDESCP